MKFVYVGSKGENDATLASIPFHLAVNGSLEVGQEVAVVLVGDAADLIVGDTAATVEGRGVPPLKDLLAKARDNGVPVYV
ncbi:MAG: DsrE family protein [Actinomycetota bacterium]